MEYWTGTDWVPVSGHADIDNNETGLPSGSNITISGAGIDPYRIYAAFPSTEDIGDTRIDASTGTQSVFLTVGKFTDSNRKPTDVKALDVAGARDVGKIESLLGRTEIQARASRDYTDDISSWQVVRLDATGELQGDVFRNPGAENSPALGVILANDVASGTQIKSYAGSIVFIQLTGDCAGSIITLDGDIGSPSSLVEITADGDGTNFGIYSIEADAIYADITGPDDQCGEAIRSIYARSGVVSGSVSSICFSTDIDDDPGDTFGLNADTDLQDLFVDLDLNFGEHINVGGVIDEDTTIRVANSFSGKADVTIDDPAGLDGWASCNGWHVDKVLGLGESLTEVTLHHDGPIEREGTGMPVTIGRRAFSQIGCTWTDVTSSFTVAMHPSGHEREIRINGIFDDGYSYLIEPKADTGSDYLYCGGLDASVGKAGVKDYDFVRRVRRIQDTTLNGLLEPDDITEWLANPIDTTLDGVVDNADLIDVTEAVANSGDW